MTTANTYYEKFLEAARFSMAMNPSYRKGQAYFNTLLRLHPELAEEIRTTEDDPFYNDDFLPAFHTFVATRLYEMQRADDAVNPEKRLEEL